MPLATNFRPDKSEKGNLPRMKQPVGFCIVARLIVWPAFIISTALMNLKDMVILDVLINPGILRFLSACTCIIHRLRTSALFPLRPFQALHQIFDLDDLC